VRGQKEPVMIKEGPLYYNDSTGWKKLYCSLQSDGRLGFSERQDKKQERTVRSPDHTRTRLASPSC
jgi:hypothetical protein